MLLLYLYFVWRKKVEGVTFFPGFPSTRRAFFFFTPNKKRIFRLFKPTGVHTNQNLRFCRPRKPLGPAPFSSGFCGFFGPWSWGGRVWGSGNPLFFSFSFFWIDLPLSHTAAQEVAPHIVLLVAILPFPSSGTGICQIQNTAPGVSPIRRPLPPRFPKSNGFSHIARTGQRGKLLAPNISNYLMSPLPFPSAWTSRGDKPMQKRFDPSPISPPHHSPTNPSAHFFLELALFVVNVGFAEGGVDFCLPA